MFSFELLQHNKVPSCLGSVFLILVFCVTFRRSVLLCFDICVLFVFRMRKRAWVAPPVDETEDELSFQDEFLPLEPPVRRRCRGRARGRPRVTSRRRQRGL